MKGKNILIVEDIYDSGRTMLKLIEAMRSQGATSVKTCCLLHKKNVENLKFNYWCDFIGFYIPNKFILGYGMDYNEYCRDLRHICCIS